MTTKADEFRRDQEQRRARRNTKARRTRKAKPKRSERIEQRETKRKNVGGAPSAKNAVVEMENTVKGTRPPRKSTRKTKNRLKSSETLEGMRQHDASRPQTKALRGAKKQGHTGPKAKTHKAQRTRAQRKKTGTAK